MRVRHRAATALLSGLALACVGCGANARPLDGSTLHVRFADPDGNGILERAGGEPLLDRTELAPVARPLEQLALFAQIADPHVTDEESPARVELLDRLGAPFASAFRPQEALTGHVLEATVAALNREQPQAVVLTGDIVDNTQLNELDEATRILRGGRVDPNSGDPGYVGVQEASDPDPFYYRPAVDAPRHPGLLTAAERPFRSPGLRAPWYPLVGNHDVLVQGNLAPTARTNEIAVGARKLVEPDAAALETARAGELSPRAVATLLSGGLPGRSRRVASDPGRRELSAVEVLRRLRRASGHGGSGPLLDYTFDIGRSLRAIVLDTARRTAGSDGVVRPGQVRWLRRALRAAGTRWVIVFSGNVLEQSTGGENALALLDADPHVVNAIEPRRTNAGGYWLITTASLVDYPQQARMFRLARTRGGVVLQTWVVDHEPDSALSRISRELAYLDVQGGRPRGSEGGPRDRNASLFR